jgi:[ribosomal protein S5]-alanine N-acetyltransferase
MKTVLETDRLLLREMSLDDLDFIAQPLAHPEVMRYWPRCYTRREAADWIQRQQLRYARDGVGYWLAISRESGQPVGQAGLMVLEVDDCEELGLGYIMHRPFWRRGYATEAAAACRNYGFSTMGRARIIAVIRPENVASQGVAGKLGMTLEKRTQYAGFEHLVFVSLMSSIPRPPQ